MCRGRQKKILVKPLGEGKPCLSEGGESRGKVPFPIRGGETILSWRERSNAKKKTQREKKRFGKRRKNDELGGGFPQEHKKREGATKKSKGGGGGGWGWGGGASTTIPEKEGDFLPFEGDSPRISRGLFV